MRKSFCFVFSLQTGVTVILLFDLIVLTCLCSLYGLNYMDSAQNLELVSATNEIKSNGTIFNLMTDGLLIALYLFKVYHGIRYLYIVYLLPKQEYQYLEEHGELKWHTRRVKRMRIEFKNYFLVSSVATVFTLL